jgi:hypothetical protein
MKQPSTQPISGLPIQPATEEVDTDTLELLAAWKVQDTTADPEQVRAAEKELADFKKAMNENRAVTGERVLFP